LFLNDIKYDWMGDVPNNWEVKRIKNLFFLKKEISDSPENEQILSLTMRGIIKRDISSNEGQLPETYNGYTKIYPDDMVMNPMDLKSGWIDRSKFDGIISPSYFVLNKLYDDLDIGYFNYQLQRHYKERIFFSFGQGVSYDYRWGLGRETILNFPIIVPPKETQSQIVSFLDNKTQKIDDLIKKTEKKIELLKEKRTFLINHCVTKGLNPNVEMKDSGVEFIGEIPTHWEMKKVKYLLNDYDGIKIGPFGSSLKLDTLTDSGIKIYGQGNVIKNNFKIGHRYLPVDRFEKDFKQYEILDGDILVTMMGTTGKSKVFSSSYERGILDSHLLRLRFNKSNFSGYLFSIILQQSDYIFHQIKLSSKGSIMEGLNSSIIKQIKVSTPPLDEQIQIIDYIDKKTQKIDSTIKKETQRIELLKEYRQSLISEVVTGKVDVRGLN
jgi:type I restriction enzyme, S subunit